MGTTAAPDQIPVTVLTGFLGSGKTTLLRRLLAAEGMERTAVVINEFGEVGLDHFLIRGVTENAVVLQNGCVCCTIRSDVRTCFRELIDGRGTGTVPEFDRIVLETTGLADPVPIVRTLSTDPMLSHHTRLSNIVATVDGMHGLGQISRRSEAWRQVALADRIVVTKSDITHPKKMERVRDRLAALNPTARCFDLHRDRIRVEDLIIEDAFDTGSTAKEVKFWLSALPETDDARLDFHRPDSRHDHAIQSFVFRTERRIDWTAFGVWLSALVHRHGERILRIKGLLDVPDAPGPLVLNAVQTVIHSPLHLDEWPEEKRSTRIVFIVDGLDGARVRRSLDLFLEQTGEWRGTDR
jgi:G3E family GTPase